MFCWETFKRFIFLIAVSFVCSCITAGLTYLVISSTKTVTNSGCTCNCNYNVPVAVPREVGPNLVSQLQLLNDTQVAINSQRVSHTVESRKTTKRRRLVTRHGQIEVALSVISGGFTLTDGVTSISVDDEKMIHPIEIMEQIRKLGAQRIIFPDD